jgi:hypothetical protein
VITALVVANWGWGLAALGVLGLIGLGIYSAFQLLGDDSNWEEREPKRHDD